jgi:undecaprenyl-diphosphatase
MWSRPLVAGGPPAVAIALAAVVTVGGLALLVTSGLTEGFDRGIIIAVRGEGARHVLAPLRQVTELGSTGGVTLVAFASLAFATLIGPWRHGIIAAATMLLASLANGSIKLAIARARPDLLEPVIEERGYSFPSGHSALGMVAYGILAVLVVRSRLPFAAKRAIVFGLGLVVGLVGISRIWLGVHYPTDVLAGWATGAVVVLLYAAITRRVSPAPAEAAVDADRAAPRSDRPAPG